MVPGVHVASCRQRQPGRCEIAYRSGEAPAGADPDARQDEEREACASPPRLVSTSLEPKLDAVMWAAVPVILGG
jgi:hypothetical protein